MLYNSVDIHETRFVFDGMSPALKTKSETPNAKMSGIIWQGKIEGVYTIVSNFVLTGDLEALCLDLVSLYKLRGSVHCILEDVYDSLEILADSWTRCPPDIPWHVVTSVKPEDICAYLKSYFHPRMKKFFCRRTDRYMCVVQSDVLKKRDILKVHAAMTHM